MLRLELVDITKDYPGTRANDGIDLQVAPGEIHAVLGENGAGKSTLMKIVYGAARPDSGQIRWNGAAVTVASPREARRLGMAMVSQHFSLFESMTVAENVWLGLDEKTSRAGVAARIREVASEYGLDVDPARPIHGLSAGERQRVEIVRALFARPSLLILDEPTSVLAPQAVEKLFATLRRLAAGGCSILYVSHKLDEIRALCHRATILRAGRVTGDVDPSTVSSAELSRRMIGADPPEVDHRPRAPGDVVLDVTALTLPPADPFGVQLDGVAFSVRAGEILGVAGISGNGQKELCAALSGERDDAPSGSIALFGEDVSGMAPRRRRAMGLRFVPEERLGRATVGALSLADNTLLTRSEGLRGGGWIDRAGLRALARRLIDAFSVKARGADAPARSLSGGNLQKFVVGREIDARPRALVVAQPTWGVDVGAAARVRAELVGLRDAGCALVVVSEDLDELFEVSDALVVMAGGRLSPRIVPRGPDAEHDAVVARIGAWMGGLWPEQATNGARREGVLGPREPERAREREGKESADASR